MITLIKGNTDNNDNNGIRAPPLPPPSPPLQKKTTTTITASKTTMKGVEAAQRKNKLQKKAGKEYPWSPLNARVSGGRVERKGTGGGV